MKKIFLLIWMMVPALMWAQVDRSKAPKPGPAPVIKVGEPASFTLPNGLKVFVVSNTKLPRVSATLTIDRDAFLEGDKAGMISMAGELLRRGTAKMNKAVLDEQIDYLGGSISVSAKSVTGFALKNNFPKMFALMADIALHPSFPADELEKIRTQELSGIAQNKEDANAIANNVVNRLVYGKDHPYGDVETEETVKRVTVGDIKHYYDTYWKPNIAYLVFVGDISLETARQLAETYFSAWQKAPVPQAIYKIPGAPAKTYIAVVDRPSSVQSVINIIAPIQMKPGAPEYIPSSVMNNLLGDGSSGRLYKNLREKYGFTYGAYSRLRSDRLVGSFTASAAVRNEKTDSAIGQFLVEFNRIRSEPVSTEDVALTKNEMSGSFARSLESPAKIAEFALDVARYHLPQDYYQNYLKNLSAVDNATVKLMADRYITPGNMHIVIVGNAKQISKGLEKYGEVKYFDVYGNEIKAPEAKSIVPGTTAESVLSKAVAAQGGEAAIAAIKDVALTGKANVMGQNLDFSLQYILPSVYVQSLGMNGMSLAKQMVRNGVYAVTQQGAEQKVDEDDKEELNEAASLFVETYFLKTKGYTFLLRGIEFMDNKDAYNVEVKSPRGRVANYYYDVQSGMRLKESHVKKSPAGDATESIYTTEYKTVNGVKLPVKQLYEMGPLKLDITITDVKVNQGLTGDALK